MAVRFDQTAYGGGLAALAMNRNWFIMLIEPNEFVKGLYPTTYADATFRYGIVKIFENRVYFAGMIKHVYDS